MDPDSPLDKGSHTFKNSKDKDDVRANRMIGEILWILRVMQLLGLLYKKNKSTLLNGASVVNVSWIGTASTTVSLALSLLLNSMWRVRAESDLPTPL